MLKIDPTLKKHELVQELTILFAAHNIPANESKLRRIAKAYKRGHITGDLAKVLTYADPTGERAVNNVLQVKKNPRVSNANPTTRGFKNLNNLAA